MRSQIPRNSHRIVRPGCAALLLAALIVLGGCGARRDSVLEEPADAVSESEGTPAEDVATIEQNETVSPKMRPSETDDSVEEEPVALMKFEEANGFEIYQHYCATCHGDAGDGAGFNAFNLDPKPRSHIDDFARESVSDEELTQSIAFGGAGRGKSPLMPPWGNTLSSRQIRYAVAYIRLLQRRAQASGATSEDE